MSAPAWTADIVTALSDSHPRLGRRVKTANGDEFIFVKGMASNAAGQWFTFNYSTYAQVILAGNAKGFVGISMGAATASQWGWAQVKGLNLVAAADSVAGAGALYIDGTNGRCDDDVVAGDLIAGAFSNAASSSNVVSVSLNDPFVTDTLS